MKQTKATKRAAAQVAQMAALTNQVRQLTALASAGNAKPSKVAKRNRKGRTQAQSLRGAPLGRKEVGNAKLIRQPRIGMADLIAHQVSWVCGKVLIGNGTLGANDGVYFLDATATYIIPGLVPILGADQYLGASYVKALDQLYRRKTLRKVSVCFQAIQSSTTNNMTLTVAPVRGPPSVSETAQGVSNTTAALDQGVVMSMTGSKTCDSFENLEIDLTPYIAGGSAAAQNEFAVGNAGVGSPVTTAVPLLGVSPCAFAVSGNSTVTALRNTRTHIVIVSTIVDYLDFIGGQTVVGPED